MKKLSLISILVLVFCFLFASNLFVKTSEGGIFEKFYPVKVKYQDTETHIFEFTDIPYLYAVLPEPVQSIFKTELLSDWTIGGSTYKADSDGLKKLHYWIDLATWDTTKTAGAWTIDGQFNVYNPFSGGLIDSGSGSTWFEVKTSVVPVIPEPMSLGLFLIGGVGLAALQIRRI